MLATILRAPRFTEDQYITVTQDGDTDYLKIDRGVNRYTADEWADLLTALGPDWTWTATGGVLTVTATPNADIVWGSPEYLGQTALRNFLGFDDDLTATAGGVTADAPLTGYWQGRCQHTFGGDKKAERMAHSGPFGTMVVADRRQRMTGKVVLWLCERPDDLADSLENVYNLAGAWVAGELVLTVDGTTWKRLLTTGDWECAPQWLDAQTATLEIDLCLHE